MFVVSLFKRISEKAEAPRSLSIIDSQTNRERRKEGANNT